MPGRAALCVACLAILVAFSASSSRAAGTLLAGDTAVESQHDSNTAGKGEAFRTVATASGTTQTVSVYVDSTSAATSLVVGIYSNSSTGHPDTLLASGSLASTAKGAWNDVPVGSTTIATGQTYWIAILSPNGTGTLQFRDRANNGASETSAQTTLTALPATWTTGARYTDGSLSAYISGGTAPTPTLQLSTTSLAFTATAGGVDPGPAPVTVSNAGAGTLTFTTQSDAAWLTATPGSGTAPVNVSVAASAASLLPGTYTGHLTVTAAGATGSPQTVTATLAVIPQAAPAASDWPQVDHDSARSGNAASETTITPANASMLARVWSQQLDGKVTAQPLFVKGAWVAGATHDVVVAATSGNSIYALDATTGAVLWRRTLPGKSSSNCAIPGGFGISGAPAIDKANGRIYTVSDDGKLYSLALADGSDAAQPLQLLPDSATNKVWGGLNLRGSDLYVATASDGCDTPPWLGRVYRVNVGVAAPQVLTQWNVITGPPNGGGGVWGYGGVAVGGDGTVYAATAADSNEGYTLYGDRMVALTPALSVLGSYLPPEPNQFPCNGAPCDLDFGASPVVFQPSGCPTLTAAGNKNGNVYLFRTADLASSGTPLQTLTLNTANDSLGSGGVGGVPAYWAAGNMVFIGDTGAGVNGIAAGAVGLRVNADCTLSVAWSASQGGSGAPNSTPTVANGVVFIGTGSTGAVQAYNAQTGAALWSSGALGSTFAAPSVGDGRLYVGSWDGSSSTSAGTIRAYAPPAPDTQPPTVSVTSPTGGSTVSGTVTLAASASDNVGVTSVQFAVDGVNVGAPDTTSPYNASWDTTTATAGTHTVTATASDAAGNKTTSTGVTVTVDNSQDTQPPTVAVTSPTAGSTVSGTITLAASASDNVGVTSVQFAVDGVNVGAPDTTSPYNASWDTTTATAGTHTVTATASDAAGNKTTSAGVTVTVNNSTLRVLLGDQTIEAQSDSNTAGKAEAFRAQATSSGTLSRITLYVAPTNAATSVVVGLYTDASGKPGTLLAQASTPLSGGGSWVNVAVPSAAVTSGATYWFAILSPAGTGTLQFRDKANGGASETSAATNLTTLPATWTTGVRYTDGSLSAYGSGT